MNKAFVKILGFAAILLTIFFIFKFTPLSGFVEKERLLAFFQAIRQRWWGPVVFIFFYGISCIAAVPGSLLTPLGGAIFGTVWGTLYNLIAATAGASLAFALSRGLGRDFVRQVLRHKKIAEFDDKIKHAGFMTILRLRLIPLIPFNGLNFGAGLSGVRFKDYFFASLFGMIPGCFVYTYFGDALLDGVQGTSRQAWLNLAAAGALLIFMSFLPVIYKKWVRRKKDGESRGL